MSNEQNLEQAFKNLFKTSSSANGEEELLRITANYTRQISGRQMLCLLALRYYAGILPHPDDRAALTQFIDQWLEYKQYHNSAPFLMRALDAISLRKLTNENTMKINVDKK